MQYMMRSVICPHCHQEDQVQKVSAVVAEGTATGTSYGWTVGHAGSQRFQGNTVTWSRQQSMLAEMLAAPRRPLPLIGCGAGLAVLLLVGTFLLILSEASTLFTQQEGILGLCFVVFAFFPLGLLVPLVRGVRQHAPIQRLARMRWERQMQHWHSLYYCHRCDGVFLPGNGVFVPSAAARTFLAQL